MVKAKRHDGCRKKKIYRRTKTGRISKVSGYSKSSCYKHRK